jgi:hypothetical protein
MIKIKKKYQIKILSSIFLLFKRCPVRKMKIYPGLNMLPRPKLNTLLTVFGVYISIVALIFLFYIYAYDSKNEIFDSRQPKKLIKNSKYIIEITEHKLNKLFAILQDKEKEYGHLLDGLGLISFTDFPNKKQNIHLKKYDSQAENFLRVESSRVKVKKRYVSYLTNKSEHFLTALSRTNVTRQKILNVSLFNFGTFQS